MIIVLKKGDEVVHEFEVTDEQIQMAKKLGIPRRDYLIAYARIKLDEKKENNES